MNSTICNNQLTVSVNHKGAELTAITDAAGRNYIWHGDPEHWGKHAPVLFPIVGRLRDDQYRHNGNTYHMSRHGFARDMAFTVREQQEHCITFTLNDTAETLLQYPFSFALDITYRLEGKILHTEYAVQNKGPENMPFSIGAHPAFALQGIFEQYSLQFEKEEALKHYLLENDLLTEQTALLSAPSGKLPLHYTLFKQDALVFKSLSSSYIHIVEKDKPLLSVGFKGFPYLGVWTKNNAPFICIEPWYGHADTAGHSGELSQKAGIIMLPPDSVFSCAFSIGIL